jgi:hypothetical protein
MKVTKVYIENLKAYKDGCRDIVNKGSARSGKTAGLWQVYHTIASLSKRHRKLSIVSHSFPHLKDGVVYEVDKHCMRENITIKHNKGLKEYYVNKSTINYFSLDSDGNKAIGPGRDILWVNEPNRGITFQNYTDLKTRTEECVWHDYNPSGEYWLHTEKILEEPTTRLIHSTWLDNIDNLSKNQIADFIRWKRLSKTSDYWKYYWKVYGLGEDAVLLEERIMPFIKWVKEVPKDAVEIPSALDFGWFPDPTAFCRIWVRRKPLKDELYIQQIFYGTKTSINTKSPGASNLVDLLKVKGINPKHKIIAAGFEIEAVTKTSVETSIRLFHDYDIHFVEGSTDAYTEFDNYKYHRNNKGVIQPIPAPGQKDHCIDGVRYVLLSRNFRWSLK